MHAATDSPEPPLELPPQAALRRLAAGVPLLDLRSPGEQASGMAEGARAVPLGELLAAPGRWLDDAGQEALLLCASGRRTLAAATELRARGYRRVSSVAGGMAQWRAAGLPLAAAPEPAAYLERHARQMLLPEVGLAGQRRLRAARVSLLGAGGLGSPVALYLAAAGIGTLRLIDDDRVERSNLHRQVLHGEADLGRPKVESAAARLAALAPELRLEPRACRLDASNARELLAGSDLVVDGADSFATRYLVNDACVALGIPLVHGAVERFRGQVAVFWPARHPQAGCYRCLFPKPPPAELVPNCAEAGVLGVLPGLVGMLQATEALKLLLGLGEPLLGRLLCVDALGMHFERLPLGRDPACPACASAADAGAAP